MNNIDVHNTQHDCVIQWNVVVQKNLVYFNHFSHTDMKTGLLKFIFLTRFVHELLGVLCSSLSMWGRFVQNMGPILLPVHCIYFESTNSDV